MPSLTLFGPGLVFFTVHYLMLRGFYALELNRTVFFIQCVVAATNIVVALLLVSRATPAETSPALVLAYLASYVVGATVSYLMLRARLGGLETPSWSGSWSGWFSPRSCRTAVAWALGPAAAR